MNADTRPEAGNGEARDGDIPAAKALDAGDVARGLRLSRLAGWNQTSKDWAFLLRTGQGYGFETPSVLAASLLLLPLGPRFSWVSMVLTDPAWQRRGLATRLLAGALADADARHRQLALDATAEGETVYRRLGFHAVRSLARWRVAPGSEARPAPAPSAPLRRLGPADLPRLAVWDGARSGLERGAVLAHLHASRPDLAWASVAPDGSLQGFILAREGDRQPQLGPLVADDPEVARALFHRALMHLDGPACVDLFDAHASVLQADTPARWTRERGFKRMIRGSPPLPETPEALFLAAGPELS